MKAKKVGFVCGPSFFLLSSSIFTQSSPSGHEKEERKEGFPSQLLFSFFLCVEDDDGYGVGTCMVFTVNTA